MVKFVHIFVLVVVLFALVQENDAGLLLGKLKKAKLALLALKSKALLKPALGFKSLFKHAPLVNHNQYLVQPVVKPMFGKSLFFHKKFLGWTMYL